MPPQTASHPRTVRAAVRAVRLKLRLMSGFGVLWPAAVRGGRLLARGRVKEFTRRLLNESDRQADSPAPPAERVLFLAGQIARPAGYDHVTLAVLRGLVAAGVGVRRDLWSLFRRSAVPPELWPADAERRPNDPRLVVAPPHLLAKFRPDARTAAFTMWETDTLPADAVAALNRCGLVVVPSRWGADCFRANGVKVPVEVVPLGHDADTFSPSPPGGGGRGVGSSNCVFGTAGALDEGGLRKNIGRVVAAFRSAFPCTPDVRLRVKITPGSPPVQTHGDPRIEVSATTLTPAELAEWYRSLTAFVNASAGEGFGLHLLEAMACGRPLVSPTFGGVGEFFDATVGYEVGYTLAEARNTIYAGRWADPSDADLVSHLRRVHRDRDEARRLGSAAAVRAARFTWADTAAKLVAALARHGFVSTGA